MAIHREVRRAARRVQSGKALVELRKVELATRLHQIAGAGPCAASGQRYLLAQNVGRSGAPLWVHLSVVAEQPGQLVFCGNRKPLEFSEREALELAPQLGAFLGEVEFQPVAGGLQHG